ncbi:defensin-like protein 1 [Mangifera indica]|uniref:defensin-like protein 1 n=1 Tax=Mangifera indica TaxID=29780 RepID=UPI001CFBC9F7|nr:defensin-like protein 1 [Mangifera indica]
MAKTLKSLPFFALLFILILVANWEMMPVEAKLCERASQTWSGKCGNTAHCDNQCQKWEDARHGACHVRDGKWKCFCYFNCPLNKHN